ncbi:hypothetical protein M8J75_014854 [Diaphorina citri]|nr:hypothetical protein M8J75_014854 [Diaphorina citri]
MNVWVSSVVLLCIVLQVTCCSTPRYTENLDDTLSKSLIELFDAKYKNKAPKVSKYVINTYDQNPKYKSGRKGSRKKTLTVIKESYILNENAPKRGRRTKTTTVHTGVSEDPTTKSRRKYSRKKPRLTVNETLRVTNESYILNENAPKRGRPRKTTTVHTGLSEDPTTKSRRKYSRKKPRLTVNETLTVAKESSVLNENGPRIPHDLSLATTLSHLTPTFKRKRRTRSPKSTTTTRFRKYALTEEELRWAHPNLAVRLFTTSTTLSPLTSTFQTKRRRRSPKIKKTALTDEESLRWTSPYQSSISEHRSMSSSRFSSKSPRQMELPLDFSQSRLVDPSKTKHIHTGTYSKTNHAGLTVGPGDEPHHNTASAVDIGTHLKQREAHNGTHVLMNTARSKGTNDTIGHTTTKDSSTAKHKETVNFTMDPDNHVVVFTDGACPRNGKVGASAGYGVYFGENNPLNVAGKVTGRVTNNNAEIQGAIHALKQAKSANIDRVCIKSDSQFMIKCVQEWMPKWQSNGWRKADGKPVQNKEELQELLHQIGQMESVKWEFVPGHGNSHGNMKADEMARDAAGW